MGLKGWMNGSTFGDMISADGTCQVFVPTSRPGLQEGKELPPRMCGGGMLASLDLRLLLANVQWQD